MSTSPHQPNSAFYSCPAATGEPVSDLLGDDGCLHFRDRAHRCGEKRATHEIHRCTCGHEWVALSVGRLFHRLAVAPQWP